MIDKARAADRRAFPGLWSDSCGNRLTAARNLTKESTAAVQTELCADCPTEPWPYGNATSINPMVVVLGPSPGNSPGNMGNPGPLCLPTAGVPHPHVLEADDTKGHWRKVRFLARSLIPSTDALVLFGQLNLDSGRAGKAPNVQVDSTFARWLLTTIRDRLRPRVVVATGLIGLLKGGPVRDLFDEWLPRFDLRQPDVTLPFDAYRKQNLVFREWQMLCPSGHSMRFVLWPQQPIRAPFTSFDYWKAACEQYAERTRGWISP